MIEEKIHEECGVFGVYSPTNYGVARDVYYGLYALQHRGQESCGIVVNDDGLFFSHKDLGQVSNVFDSEELNRLPDGNMAVGHVRYGTTGGDSRRNTQPIEVNHQKGKLSLPSPPNAALSLSLIPRDTAACRHKSSKNDRSAATWTERSFS